MVCPGGWLTDGKPEGGALVDVELDVAEGGRTS